MTRGLFTSLEEIAFQRIYVQGNVEKVRDPNTKRLPQKFLCAKRKNKNIPKAPIGRIR